MDIHVSRTVTYPKNALAPRPPNGCENPQHITAALSFPGSGRLQSHPVSSLPACPGGPDTPCNNRGVCLDQYSATGRCRCNTGFNGTACELCWPKRFGPNCQRKGPLPCASLLLAVLPCPHPCHPPGPGAPTFPFLSCHPPPICLSHLLFFLGVVPASIC
jgi:hypothetical protein